MNKKKPNFFIVGAAKAGTTSLYHYLKSRSEVYMSPIKEPHYFSKDIRSKSFNKEYRKSTNINIKNYFKKEKLEHEHIAFIENEDDYLKLFREAKTEKLLGEISNGYLYSEVAAKEIYNFNKEAKIIIILRNPIDRAFSHWLMDLRGQDVCRRSFIEAIEEDQSVVEKWWGKSHLYVELGLYYDQIMRYKTIFPEEQLLILLYDDMLENQNRFYQQICQFIKIPFYSDNSTKRYNVASVPRFPLLNMFNNKTKLNFFLLSLLTKQQKSFLKEKLYSKNKLKLMQDDKIYLLQFFLKDIKKIEKLLSTDLGSWYKDLNK
jgi:hypothetical protein